LFHTLPSIEGVLALQAAPSAPGERSISPGAHDPFDLRTAIMSVSQDAPLQQPATRFVRYVSSDQEIPLENARDALRGLKDLLLECPGDLVKVQDIGRIVELISDRFAEIQIGEHMPRDTPPLQWELQG
jgi:hypothetical protein